MSYLKDTALFLISWIILLMPVRTAEIAVPEVNFQPVEAHASTTTEVHIKLVPAECYCIKALRLWGLPMIMGKDAIDLIPNTTPAIGNVILFNYDNIGHAALITDFDGSGVYIKEANKTPCEISTRYIPWDYPFIRGFYHPNLDNEKTAY